MPGLGVDTTRYKWKEGRGAWLARELTPPGRGGGREWGVVATSKKAPSAVDTRWWQRAWGRRFVVAFVLTCLWSIPLLSVNAWVGSRAHLRIGVNAHSTTTPFSGASSWLGSAKTTSPTFSFATPDAHHSFVDPLFQAYYATNAGAQQLGPSITPAVPTSDGWLQFFADGALFLPKAGATINLAPGSGGLYAAGARDTVTNVIRLPLAEALLASGSTLPVGGDTSTLTYADLRLASRSNTVVTNPTDVSAGNQQGGQSEVFIYEGQSSAGAVGHLVPMDMWDYITNVGAAPDGWQTDFGNPLSEALPATVSRQGSIHHLLVQVFWRGIVVEDRGVTDSDGDPLVSRLDTGADYLRTFGPPHVSVASQTSLWALGDSTVLSTPDTGSTLIHIGQNFPLTARGDVSWTTSGLWYHVQWKTRGNQGSGWTPALAMTFTAPAHGSPAWGGFDALSADLQAYLNSQGDNASAVVYDVTRGQYYTYNVDGQFIMASSAKVPIMLTFLTMTEAQGREPDDNEMYLLTTMIENSDNDSAQALFDEVGGAPAMSSFLNSVGVGGIAPNADGWGYSTTTPLAMVQLLTLLHQGKVLNAQDRSLAFNLMENIEPDQQTGVGDTAPNGATVAMKDGWVPGPDNLWAMNSSGIVTVGSETYIIAVYTQHENELQDGWNITEHVCGAVGQLLA